MNALQEKIVGFEYEAAAKKAVEIAKPVVRKCAAVTWKYLVIAMQWAFAFLLGMAGKAWTAWKMRNYVSVVSSYYAGTRLVNLAGIRQVVETDKGLQIVWNDGIPTVVTVEEEVEAWKKALGMI